MNSVSAYRRSIMAPPVFLVDETGADEAYVRRRRTFRPVDWPAFKENCELERASTADTMQTLDLADEKAAAAEPAPIGFLEGLARILTVYPWRDAQWIVSVLFIIGSVAFTASSFLALTPLVFPATAFPGEMDVAFPTSITIGAGLFFIGGNLATVASFNVTRGPVPGDGGPGPGPGRKGSFVPSVYNPALLGSDEWIWAPSWAELRAVFLPNPAFRAGLVSTLGGLVLTGAAVGGNPLLLGAPDDPGFPRRLRDFVLVPLTIGGALLTVGSLAVTVLVQERWYKPALGSVVWHASFWNTVGAASLALGGLYSILVPEDLLSAAIINFVATWLFFVAAYLQWHMLMVF